VSEKLKQTDELREIVRQAKRNGRKVVFTNGCFDILHRGHLEILRGAKSYGDILIVALNTDRSVRSIKGPSRPVVAESDRAELIAALEMVDYVILFDELEPTGLIAELEPDVLVKGGDYGIDRVVGADVVRRYGGEVAVVPFVQGFSTSAIIERIRG